MAQTKTVVPSSTEALLAQIAALQAERAELLAKAEAAAPKPGTPVLREAKSGNGYVTVIIPGVGTLPLGPTMLKYLRTEAGSAAVHKLLAAVTDEQVSALEGKRALAKASK